VIHFEVCFILFYISKSSGSIINSTLKNNIFGSLLFIIFDSKESLYFNVAKLSFENSNIRNGTALLVNGNKSLN
jgi:hypothetical protein